MIEAAGARASVRTSSPIRCPAGASTRWASPRMGDDPKTSVLTQFCRTHDIDNLYVMDGSAFVSIACQNPTLTIMALTVRSTDHLLEEMRKGNV